MGHRLHRAIWLCAGLLSALGAQPCLASAYSDFNTAISLRQINACDKAVPFYSAAVAKPDLLADLRPVAYLGRGQCYVMLKKDDLALADFDQSIALRPDYFDAYVLRGFLRVRNTQYTGALSDLDMAVRIRPDLPKGYKALAFLHLQQKDYDAVVADFTKLVALDLDPYEALFLRSDAFVLKGDLDSAMDDADKMVALNAKGSLGFVARARVYSHRSLFSRAMDAYASALQLEPENGSAIFGKALAQWSAGDFDGAEKTLAFLAPHAPEDGYTALWLNIARVAGDKPDADFADRAQKIDLKEWPGPALNLYLGQTTPDAVLQAARDGEEFGRESRLCEARFFVAEWQLQRQAKDAALPLLNAAVQDCPRTNIERDAAAAQLERLR